jgi:hypothetical protein
MYGATYSQIAYLLTCRALHPFWVEASATAVPNFGTQRTPLHLYRLSSVKEQRSIAGWAGELESYLVFLDIQQPKRIEDWNVLQRQTLAKVSGRNVEYYPGLGKSRRQNSPN